MRKVVLLSLLALMSGVCFAEDNIQNENNITEPELAYIMPVIDVSRLENMKIELSNRQKNKINKLVDKTNKKINKIENKIEKTKLKIADVKDSALVIKDNYIDSKNRRLEQLRELNTQLANYQVDMVKVSKENKAKITKILTKSQNDSLKKTID